MQQVQKRFRLKNLNLIGAGLCLVWILSGCATQAMMVDLELAQEKIRLEQSQIQEHLREIGKSFEEGASTNRNDQTDVIIRQGQMATEIQTLRGKWEETSFLSVDLAQRMDDLTFRMKEFMDRMDSLDRQVVLLERSIGKLSQSGSTEELGGSDVPPNEAQRKPDKAIVLPGRPGEGVEPTGLSPSEAYGLAYNDYIKGNYDLALMGFRNFLSQYKNTSLASNAQYWMGESYYGQKKYRKAIGAFQQVVSEYPESNKVPGAVLKTGYSYMEMADRERGRLHLKKVIEDYPFSNEAKLARNRLAKLK